MKIGIVGGGHIGSILAGHFRQLQHTVLIANSRSPETLSNVAAATGAVPVYVSEVANGVDLLVIAVPIASLPLLPKDMLARVPATSPIIDTTNYYPDITGSIQEIDAGMVESQWTSLAVGRSVIKAFNSISADSLRHKGLPNGSQSRIAIPVSGDDAQEKMLVISLVNSIGFDALDAGSLAESWRYQPGTPAYCLDPTIQQLPALLRQANLAKAVKKRDGAAKMLGKVILQFPQAELVRVVRLSGGLDTFKPRSWVALFRLVFAVMGSKLKGSSAS